MGTQPTRLPRPCQCNPRTARRISAALEKILSSGKGLVIPCESTGATITIEFGVPVGPTYPKSLSTTTGRTVTYSVGDLEATPTDFDVMLDVCNEAPGSSIILSVDYKDDQRNKPDLSRLKGMVVGNDLCAAAPTPAPTPKPTNKPNVNAPKRTDNLKKGKATDTKYLGCYVPKKKNKLLSGPVTTWDGMTTQVRKSTDLELSISATARRLVLDHGARERRIKTP